MNLSDFSFSTLGEYSCDLQSFDCGREDINEFFRNDALQYQDELFGKTYLFSPRDNLNQIAAAFTVANASIFTRLLPNSRQKKVGYEVHHSKNQIEIYGLQIHFSMYLSLYQHLLYQALMPKCFFCL